MEIKKIYVGIDDLISAAFIKLYEEYGISKIKFYQLEEYNKLISIKLNEDNIKYYSILSRDSTTHFFNQNTKNFDYTENNGQIDDVILKETVDIDSMKKFFDYKPIELYQVLFDNEIIKKAFINKVKKKTD